MARPALLMTVEPSEGSKAVGLSIAPSMKDGQRFIKIVLCLTIKNQESSTVEMEGVEFSFPGSDLAPFKMRGVKSYLVQTQASENAKIPAGATIQWSNGIVPVENGDDIQNMVFVPAPAPPKVRVSVSCEGFDQPAEVTVPLDVFTRPTNAGAFLFPFSTHDLRAGEYFVTSATHWSNGGLGGTQIFAHDIGVEGYDSDITPLSSLLPGTDGSKNEHYRIWRKPVRAMADGTVESWLDTTEENTVLKEFPKDPDESNHVWVKHGDEYVAYKHLKKGSIPAELKRRGAPVKAGQQLGVVGNTGNSTNPHTHIECHRDSTSGPLRPFPFRSAWVLLKGFPPHPTPEGPWVELTADGISREEVAIWPSEKRPTWYPRSWGEVAYYGLSAARYQVIFDRVTSSGYRPIWVDGYAAAGDLHFNVIFRPSDGISTSARHGMSGEEYQREFDEQKKKGRRLVNLSTYLSGFAIRYAAIWADSGGPSWRAYHGLSADEHQRRVEALVNEGFRPVNVSVVSFLGNRSYTALFDKADVGKFQLKSYVTAGEYQKLWDENEKLGRKLSYVNVCQDLDGPHFSAIFEQNPAGSGKTVGKHGLTSSQMQQEYNEQLGNGLLTQCIAGYDHDGEHRFAAAWRKL